MNAQTAKELYKLTNRFYAENAGAFSATRRSPWVGWQRCFDTLRAHDAFTCNQLRICDMACGNMRFYDFVQEALLPELTKGLSLSYLALDNCESLACPKENATYCHCDAIENMLAGAPALCALDPDMACDLAVSFGFLHHIPTARLRATFLSDALSCVAPGGWLVVSLWQFMKDEGLARKAHIVHEQALVELGLDAAQLEAGDFIIGWNNKPGAYRYCHHFSDEEIEELVASVADWACLVDSFEADGRTGTLNTYLVLQKL